MKRECLCFNKRKRRSFDVIKLVSCLVITLFFFRALSVNAIPAVSSSDMEVLQQKVTVTGTVKDETGSALPGVTILEKGTNNGTITDANGHYSITVEPNATLVFSFVGMETQEILVGEQTQIDVNLKTSTQKIEEVVAIGYGTQTKSTLTSAVTQIKAEEIQNTPSINPVQALQGKAPGLDVRITTGMPGSGANVIVRGGTSTSPDNDHPLFVIDGVIRNDMNDINPEDIQSVQVLKDAASTAIYGARGANGIVLITTKSGGLKKGTGTFTLDYNTQVETLMKKYPWSSARDYIWAERTAAAANLDLVNSDVRLSNGAYPYSTNNISNTQHGGGYGNSRYTVEFLDDLIAAEGQDYVDNKLNNEGYQTMDDPVTGRKLIFLDNDYQNVMFNTGVSHDINLGFSGGTDKANIYSSLGYVDQQGIVRGTYYKRASYLLNANYLVKDNFKVNAGMSFQNANYRGPDSYNGMINRSSRLPYTARMYYDDGTPAIGEGGGSPRNILHELYYKDYKDDRNTFTLRLGTDWEIVKGLHFKPSSSLYMNEFRYNFFEKYNDWHQQRNMSSKHSLTRQIMFDGLLTYDKTFHDVHNFQFLLGTNYTDNYYYILSGSGKNAPTDYIPTLNASNTEDERVSSTITDDVLLSYFGRVNYNFKSKYLLNISARMDGSSRFAEKKRWSFFPAVSAGWNINKEDFWSSDIISRMKIRGSWGQAGNNVLSITDTQGEYRSGYNYTWLPGILNSKLANNELVWETTTTGDIGLDMGMWNNRLNVSFDVYNKLTSNRLVSIPMARQTGFSSIVSNYGSLRNRGLELGLNTNVMQKKNFSWNIDFNFSFNRLVVVKLPDNGKDKNRINGGVIYDKKQGKYITVGGLAEGERLGGIWAFHNIGVYSTDAEASSAPYDTKVSGYWLTRPEGEQKKGGDAIWEDVDQNDTIDNRDLVFIGYKAPDKIGGMVNTVRWKSFTVRIAMDFAMGHVISNGWRARANGNARNRVMTTTDVISGEMWWEQGDQAKYPRYSAVSDWDNGKRNHYRRVTGYSGVCDLSYASANSLYFSKGDFLAFREISLSYNFPAKIISRLSISNLLLYGGVYNIGYLTAYDGISPEHYNGYERGDYYRPRQFKFGAKFTF